MKKSNTFENQLPIKIHFSCKKNPKKSSSKEKGAKNEPKGKYNCEKHDILVKMNFKTTLFHSQPMPQLSRTKNSIHMEHNEGDRGTSNKIMSTSYTRISYTHECSKDDPKPRNISV